MSGTADGGELLHDLCERPGGVELVRAGLAKPGLEGRQVGEDQHAPHETSGFRYRTSFPNWTQRPLCQRWSLAWETGKRARGVVWTKIPRSRNGFPRSLRCVAPLMTLCRVRFLPPRLSASTIVYA